MISPIPVRNPASHPDRLRLLRTFQFLNGLGEEKLHAIAVHCRPRSLAKGQFLFREGERSLGFYLVESGTICLHRPDVKGQECVLAVFHAGESFAEATLCALDRYPASARALIPSRVLLVDRQGFVSLLHADAEIARRVLASMGTRLHCLARNLVNNRSQDAETRLMQWLLQAEPGPHRERTVELGMPKNVLASSLGLTAATLSRTLGRLCARGLIRIRGRTITILNPAGGRTGCPAFLSRVAECSHDPGQPGL